MKKLENNWVIGLLISILFVVLPSFVFANGRGEEAREEETVTKPSISFLVPRAGNADFPDENVTRDRVSEKLSIEFNPIFCLWADHTTVKSTMIASGDLPDIMLVDLADIQGMVEGNTIIPLDDLLKSAKNIMEKYNADDFASCKYDNKIYAVPSKAPWARVVSLRGDWLENLGIGLETLQDYSLDDLYNVLKRFKEEDPDGNGKDDTIPWATLDDPEYLDPFWAAFGYRVHELYEKDGMVVHGAVFPELNGGLKYMRKLFKEGLLDPEFCITSDTLVREKLTTGKFGAFYHNFPVSDITEAAARQTVPGFSWESVPPPMGPDGKRGIMKDTPTHLFGRVAITSACKNPDRAMELLDYIASDEGFYMLHFGIEGEDYEIGDDGIITRLLVKEDGSLDMQAVISMGLVAYKSFPNNPSPEFNEGTPKGLARLAQGEKYGVIGLQLYSPAPSLKDYEQGLKDIIKEHYLKMIVGDENIDTMFDDFVKAYMQNGGEILGKENYEIYKAQGT